MSQERGPLAKSYSLAELGLSDVRALPADVARCAGYEPEPGDFREGCEDCLRRTDRSTFPLQVWIAPPLIIAFECESRIPPDGVIILPTPAK